MSNKILETYITDYYGEELRFVIIAGKPWFVLKDV